MLQLHNSLSNDIIFYDNIYINHTQFIKYNNKNNKNENYIEYNNTFYNFVKTKTDTPILCLNMIVKNESNVIIRAIESVISIIDCFCICDTGSSDNTIELIVNYFNSKQIYGIVFKEEFKDFSYNRNISLDKCRGMSDFILCIDADMVLHIDNFDKTILNNYDLFNILQGNNNFFYQNTRIIKNNSSFKYTGVTHEYIVYPEKSNLHIFDKNILFIHDLGDGGCKNDKFERDITLLTNALVTEPTNNRYIFYLANSYFDNKQYQKAIQVYTDRINIGGWFQEVWYSYYRIGLSYKYLDKYSNAIFYWLNAFDIMPNRIENIYEIILYYRTICKYQIAYKFYLIAKQILDDVTDYDKQHFLFIHNDIYTFKLHQEYTILAAYVGLTNINTEFFTILNNSYDDDINLTLLKNLKYYQNILQPIHTFTFNNSVKRKIYKENISFISSTSSMVKCNDEYIMNIRYVNYTIDTNGNYLNCDKHIISINKMVKLNKEFQIIQEKWFDLILDNRQYMGVEDIRLFCPSSFSCLNNVTPSNLSPILFIGNTLHKNNNIGVCIGNYNTKTENKTLIHKEIKASIKKNTSNNHTEHINNSRDICRDRRDNKTEKNWVYFIFENEVHIIYDWFPLQIYKIYNGKNNIELIHLNDNIPSIFRYFRGSTCGVSFYDASLNTNEIWFICHMVSYEQPRCYYHLFVIFDDKLNLLRYSPPFKFEGTSIEYCLSLIVNQDNVIINYSSNDSSTKIALYDKQYIDKFIGKHNTQM